MAVLELLLGVIVGKSIRKGIIYGYYRFALPFCSNLELRAEVIDVASSDSVFHHTY